MTPRQAVASAPEIEVGRWPVCPAASAVRLNSKHHMSINSPLAMDARQGSERLQAGGTRECVISTVAELQLTHVDTRCRGA